MWGVGGAGPLGGWRPFCDPSVQVQPIKYNPPFAPTTTQQLANSAAGVSFGGAAALKERYNLKSWQERDAIDIDALSVELRRAPFQLRLRRLVAPLVAPSHSATDGLAFCSTRLQTRRIAALWPACAAAFLDTTPAPAPTADDTFDPKDFGPQASQRIATFLIFLT
jgi:hypothetical protein